MSITSTNLESLIPFLRLRIGDINVATYRYTDEWLNTALAGSVKTLEQWWNFKYLLDSDYNIYRNTNCTFLFDETTYGIIEPGDDQTIILMAAIIILGGSLENSAWDFGSWKDYEISYSNIESSKARGSTLDRLWNEMLGRLKPPQKRLAVPLKNSLPGYLNNSYERKDSDLG
jgi:hypothetical protein